MVCTARYKHGRDHCFCVKWVAPVFISGRTNHRALKTIPLFCNLKITTDASCYNNWKKCFLVERVKYFSVCSIAIILLHLHGWFHTDRVWLQMDIIFSFSLRKWVERKKIFLQTEQFHSRGWELNTLQFVNFTQDFINFSYKGWNTQLWYQFESKCSPPRICLQAKLLKLFWILIRLQSANTTNKQLAEYGTKNSSVPDLIWIQIMSVWKIWIQIISVWKSQFNKNYFNSTTYTKH